MRILLPAPPRLQERKAPRVEDERKGGLIIEWPCGSLKLVSLGFLRVLRFVCARGKIRTPGVVQLFFSRHRHWHYLSLLFGFLVRNLNDPWCFRRIVIRNGVDESAMSILDCFQCGLFAWLMMSASIRSLISKHLKAKHLASVR